MMPTTPSSYATGVLLGLLLGACDAASQPVDGGTSFDDAASLPDTAALDGGGAVDRTLVAVETGLLRGIEDEGAHAFRGVPFAAPPVGPLRLAPPAAPAHWEGERDASTYGSACAQYNWGGISPSYQGSEDCLFLNVWTPADRAEDDRGAPLLETFNGPEFGVDATGWSIYYTRVESDGTHQVVRSRFDATGTLDTVALTRGPMSHFSAMPTRDPLSPDTRLVLLRRPEPWGTATWIDTATPEVEHDLFFLADRPDADVRFVPGTRLLVTDGLDVGTGREEIVVFHTDGGTTERVSDGGGPFFNGYGWRDATGTLHVLALTDDARITVWTREAAGWTRLGALPSPDPERLPYIGSPEPFVLGARSYVLFAASSTVDPRPGVTDQQIWVGGAQPSDGFAQRVDDGRSGVTRVDPEVAIDGDSIVAVYYELVGRRSVTWSCHTRLTDPG